MTHCLVCVCVECLAARLVTDRPATEETVTALIEACRTVLATQKITLGRPGMIPVTRVITGDEKVYYSAKLVEYEELLRRSL